MKIYIVSSWKNAQVAVSIAQWLRDEGHEVDCFADTSTGRYVFHWSEMLGGPDKSKSELNAKTFLQDERSQGAFHEDKKLLDWCECCILLLPAGNSSHLEAGYVKGQGKKLIIHSLLPFPKGEFDVMYGFADLLTDQILEAVNWLGRNE